jgi:hypothetical protein
MDPTYPSGDKPVADGLRQQAINDVLRHFGDHQETDIEAALTTALMARGLPAPTPEWLEGVASEISTGNTYVVSSESQFMAAALEMPEHPKFAAALPPPTAVPASSESPDTSVASDHVATSDPAVAPAAFENTELIRLHWSRHPAPTRERFIAGILVGLAVVVGTWVRRTRRRRSTRD